MSESGDRMDDDDVTAGRQLDGARGPPLTVTSRSGPRPASPQHEVVFDVRDLSVYYGSFQAVRDVNLSVYRNQITALIGPSGCGKTTFLRCLNRMNDLIEGARVEGKVLVPRRRSVRRAVDPVEVRRRIGMVFQKPNPFPKSIYENIAFGPKIAGFKGEHGRAGRGVAPQGGALGRGEGQAQGVRHVAVGRAAAAPVHRPCDRDEPDVILMDEPCSALDPIATPRIEDLMAELVADYTIVIVTHNMQQAARVVRPDGVLHGRGVETTDSARVRSWRWTPRSRCSRTRPTTDGGLRDGTVRMTPRDASIRNSSRIGAGLLGELANEPCATRSKPRRHEDDGGRSP